ncbi:MAG: GNAT family N-acetyltransferase [Thermoplasmata archaeon]|nr:GNAT family N-acetyltransferase [Thermoplasmata archaeon]
MSSVAPPLVGRKVTLRAPGDADLPTVFGWYMDPELVSPFDRYSIDTMENLASSIRAAPGDPTSLAPRYVVESIDGGPIVGCVGHFTSHPVLTFVELWYLIGRPSARGAGFGSDAVATLVGHLFATTATERISASSDVENAGSYKLLERIGFRREGTFRSALYHHARWHDVAIYGVTRSEWATRATPAT